MFTAFCCNRFYKPFKFFTKDFPFPIFLLYFILYFFSLLVVDLLSLSVWSRDIFTALLRFFSCPVLSEATQSLMRIMNLLFFLFKYSHSVSYLRCIIFILVGWSINLSSHGKTPSSAEYLAVDASKNVLLFIKCLLSNILKWLLYYLKMPLFSVISSCFIESYRKNPK